MPRKTPEPPKVVTPLKPASMRPRPDAAENGLLPPTAGRCRTGFNEAAARCRGKLGYRYRTDKRHRASMRPRPDAAENL